MKRAAAVALVLLASAPARAEDPTVAAAAFTQAEALAKQGKWAEACPLYDASYRADGQIGVLLHLADCHEHIGHLASAAAEFGDAAELAHRKGDNREAYAQGRADALAPRLAHLHLAPPATPIPGVVVLRDGTDVTVLVGTDMPIDPGDHEVRATAPGRLEWRKKLTIGVLPTTTPLDIPPLELAPVTPEHPIEIAPPAPTEGTLVISTRAGAQIFLDGKQVGSGRYEAKLAARPYQLRISAPGMRTYQGEVTVIGGETRTSPIALDAELETVPREEPGPSYELGASLAPGVKLHADDPVVVAYRLELALRLGRRINFGVFTELGSIDPNSGRGACGTNLPGSVPGSAFDFGARDQFTRCAFVMPGVQVYAHVLPKGRLDPYVGLAPGFRFELMKWVPFAPNGAMGVPQSSVFPGIVTDVRAGLDYHPTPAFRGWQIGALVSAEVTVYGQESAHGGGGSTYLSLFGGLRSTIQF